MELHRALLLATALAAPLGFAQTPTPAPDKPIVFDVAVFRINKTDSFIRGFSIPAGGDGFRARNRPMSDLIRYAFGRSDNGGSFRISGQPDWVDTDKYDVQAKVAPEDLAAWQKLNSAEQKLVLQRFLVESLKLRYHADTASHPYYALIVGKSGVKMQEYKPGDTFRTQEGLPTSEPGVCHMISTLEAAGQGCAMDHLASLMAHYADRPILNKTGLTSTYNFDLHFEGTPDPPSNYVLGLPLMPRDVATESIRRALKQVGLELVPAEGPLDGIVVDHIERPTEN
jgi:uncharacterized protein (TIGR03435 family)